MLSDNARVPQIQFPSRAAPDRGTAERRLALLSNWRAGALATVIVMAGLLPFAIAWRERHLIAIAAALGTAAALAIGVQAVRRQWLTRMMLSPELAGLEDLAAERRRLQSPRTRHALAAGLRRTADPNQPPTRFDPCPVLTDRAQQVRAELLELADVLEQTPTPDPASVALLRELLRDGASPLYNPNLPASELHTILARASAGITAHPRT
jgi:hypothetical protein